MADRQLVTQLIKFSITIIISVIIIIHSNNNFKEMNNIYHALKMHDNA